MAVGKTPAFPDQPQDRGIPWLSRWMKHIVLHQLSVRVIEVDQDDVGSIGQGRCRWPGCGAVLPSQTAIVLAGPILRPTTCLAQRKPQQQDGKGSAKNPRGTSVEEFAQQVHRLGWSSVHPTRASVRPLVPSSARLKV
jgi:hypothetical protein